MSSDIKFFGMYRGTVVNNIDPMQVGRIQAMVPDVSNIMLKSLTGASIIVNDTGIYIQNGKGASLTLVGPTININNGALTII